MSKTRIRVRSEHVYVWHAGPKEKDPILVGTNGSVNSSNGEWFLLARWGEVLEPLKKLADRAVEKFKAKSLSQLIEWQNMLKAKVDSLKALPDSVDACEDFSMPSVYGR